MSIGIIIFKKGVAININGDVEEQARAIALRYAHLAKPLTEKVQNVTPPDLRYYAFESVVMLNEDGTGQLVNIPKNNTAVLQFLQNGGRFSKPFPGIVSIALSNVPGEQGVAFIVAQDNRLRYKLWVAVIYTPD